MLLIFDLDNTLIDRNQAYAKVIKQWILELAGSVWDDELQMILDRILLLDNDGFNESRNSAEQIVQQLNHAKNNNTLKSHNISVEYYWQQIGALVKTIKPNHEVNSLLKTLAKKHQLALLTNGTIERQNRKIKAAGLDGMFDGVFISQQIQCGKPDLSAFQQVLTTFGQTADQCMMIGDNEINDILPAKRLKMKTCLITGFNSNNSFQSQADHQLKQVNQLSEYIEQELEVAFSD